MATITTELKVRWIDSIMRYICDEWEIGLPIPEVSLSYGKNDSENPFLAKAIMDGRTYKAVGKDGHNALSNLIIKLALGKEGVYDNGET